MAALPQSRLSAREALTIARIVRVNHAGEYGAIRIYGAQISAARSRFPDMVPVLANMLDHEKQHCAAFFAAMPARGSRPCRVMSLWSLGGWLLGFLTALAGRQAIWICTAAVEAAVHRHLDDQLVEEAGLGLAAVAHGEGMVSLRPWEDGNRASLIGGGPRAREDRGRGSVGPRRCPGALPESARPPGWPRRGPGLR